MGSVNTILLGPDDGRGSGDNTDVPGAQAALRERGLEARSARIVGGGATATSIAYALAALGLTRPRDSSSATSPGRRSPRRWPAAPAPT